MPEAPMTHDEWFGELQAALEAALDDAPDDACRAIARDFLQRTYEFEDDE